eukprot:CAMPEP_0179941182 /NCGR_PEP_ID=MMETSP0983-20121128/16804_1 /TAXON_ID=483367 /ORGANISM="non described non described, Strain CCMP 2436" /LENGTH=155 /DNA_ID=CAMNT_0021848115 /DNA_START=155 /DNA_END=619 /DNA_ORIENTATION=-
MADSSTSSLLEACLSASSMASRFGTPCPKRLPVQHRQESSGECAAKSRLSQVRCKVNLVTRAPLYAAQVTPRLPSPRPQRPSSACKRRPLLSRLELDQALGAQLVEDAVAAHPAADGVVRLDVVHHAAVAAQVVHARGPSGLGCSRQLRTKRLIQ